MQVISVNQNDLPNAFQFYHTVFICLPNQNRIPRLGLCLNTNALGTTTVRTRSGPSVGLSPGGEALSEGMGRPGPKATPVAAVPSERLMLEQ